MQTIQHSTRTRAVMALALAILALGLRPADAAGGGRPILTIGTHVAPPFVIKSPEGKFSGIGIELWQKIAARLGMEYKIREMEMGQLMQGLQNGTLDVAAGAITVTAERLKKIDFSHPFYRSGLSIALIPNDGDKLASILKSVFSFRFLQASAALAVLLLLIGLCIWLLERKANARQFGGKAYQGLGDGFWWAAVTMTTVGFGDKAPVTFLGRLLAIIWMFASVITISGFTAAIASVFTMHEIEGHIHGPQDLDNITSGIVKDTTSEVYADRHRLRTLNYGRISEAMAGLAEHDVQAVVYDAPILSYLANAKPFVGITVLPNTFMRQDYAFALPEHSPLREKINVVLLEQLNSEDWKNLLSRYLGKNILEQF